MPLYLPDPRLDEIILREMAAQNVLIIGLTQLYLVDPNQGLLRSVNSRIIDLPARSQKMNHTHLGSVKILNQSRATAHQTPRRLKFPIGNKTLRQQTTGKVLRQVPRIPLVGYDSISTALRNRSRGNHSTVHPQFLQILVQYIATRRRLIASTKCTVLPVNVFHEARQLV